MATAMSYYAPMPRDNYVDRGIGPSKPRALHIPPSPPRSTSARQVALSPSYRRPSSPRSRTPLPQIFSINLPWAGYNFTRPKPGPRSRTSERRLSASSWGTRGSMLDLPRRVAVEKKHSYIVRRIFLRRPTPSIATDATSACSEFSSRSPPVFDMQEGRSAASSESSRSRTSSTTLFVDDPSSKLSPIAGPKSMQRMQKYDVPATAVHVPSSSSRWSLATFVAGMMRSRTSTSPEVGAWSSTSPPSTSRPPSSQSDRSDPVPLPTSEPYHSLRTTAPPKSWDARASSTEPGRQSLTPAPRSRRLANAVELHNQRSPLLVARSPPPASRFTEEMHSTASFGSAATLSAPRIVSPIGIASTPQQLRRTPVPASSEGMEGGKRNNDDTHSIGGDTLRGVELSHAAAGKQDNDVSQATAPTKAARNGLAPPLDFRSSRHSSRTFGGSPIPPHSFRPTSSSNQQRKSVALQKVFDAATGLLAQTLSLPLVYLLAVDITPEKTATRLLSAEGLSHQDGVVFDPSLHVQALRSAEGGLLYRNPDYRKGGKGYASGILLAVMEKERLGGRVGFVLACFTKDSRRIFLQKDLEIICKYAEELEHFVAFE